MSLFGLLVMALNGSDFISDPFNITFSAYTNLFGGLFWLIPLSGIAMALFVKTRNPSMVMGFLVAGSLLLSSGHMFLGAPEMATIYLVFSALALTGLIMNIYFSRKVG